MNRSLAFVLLLVSATACQGSRVSMEEIDGVLYITNPDEPLRPNMKIEFEELFRIGDDETAADGFMGLHVESRGLGGSMLEMDYLLRRFDAGGDTLNTLSKSTFEIDYMDMQMGKFVDDRLGTCPAAWDIGEQQVQDGLTPITISPGNPNRFTFSLCSISNPASFTDRST